MSRIALEERNNVPITFTPHEIEDMAKNPAALHAAADYHWNQEAMAGAIGEPETDRIAKMSEDRARELEAEADRIETEIYGHPLKH